MCDPDPFSHRVSWRWLHRATLLSVFTKYLSIAFCSAAPSHPSACLYLCYAVKVISNNVSVTRLFEGPLFVLKIGRRSVTLGWFPEDLADLGHKGQYCIRDPLQLSRFDLVGNPTFIVVYCDVQNMKVYLWNAALIISSFTKCHFSSVFPWVENVMFLLSADSIASWVISVMRGLQWVECRRQRCVNTPVGASFLSMT